MNGPKDWYVYIVCCNDGSLYTGISTDLGRRVDEHNFRKSGARYTRSRRPVHLVYYEKLASRSEALKRECEIKKQPPGAKRSMVASFSDGVYDERQ